MVSDVREVPGVLVDDRIAGALFDFLGYASSGDKAVIKGNMAPVVEALGEWAKLRGLSLDEADVKHWHERL